MSSNSGATISISNTSISPLTLSVDSLSGSNVVFPQLQEAEARIESLEQYVRTLAEMVEKLVEVA